MLKKWFRYAVICSKKYEHRLNYIKLIKLLYLADKESLKNSTHAITGDTYISMKNRHVLSQRQ
jgi:hypothetical protein